MNLAIPYFYTRVSATTEDATKKISRVVKFSELTIDDTRVIGAENLGMQLHG